MSAEERVEFELDMLACSIAEAFTTGYYYALEKDRTSIAEFYCPKLAASDSTIPFIAWNGSVYNDGIEFQNYFEMLTHTHYDLEALDCNILNPKLVDAAAVRGGTADDAKDLDRRMAVQVVATGSVRLEEPLKGPIREFSETFVLVPNPERLPSAKPTFEKGWQKEWLIQTQNFRFTEWGANEVGGGNAIPKEVVMKTNGVTEGRNKGIAQQFAAAGLLGKGKARA
ncbi:hypothetical protein M011DRAFT_475409 [Sporormia fimetaria CBS 119925]|uniref:NTF2 domain-containing protein n=1 Tax=Sporormia fimetaria CBS 119925 TaxID=1340428 RepID=A0A6A6VFH2_9PLEO|nr:hypothetical protein M011DRAFT_475409 [Sporormia fimetaria CBS 119925]